MKDIITTCMALEGESKRSRIKTILEVKIESYERLIKRAEKQAFQDSECGYHGSYQFNKGKQFALETALSDLKELLKEVTK